jgi:oligoribonuclease NrnB/cAMP/cGMP phosphodiesterase (DHH superfamily)
METICFYHANCLDGFGSAHIVRNYYGGQHVRCVPVNYGDDWEKHLMDWVPIADRIMFVDFCPPVEVLDILSDAKNGEVIVLDHHKTAKELMFSRAWPEHMHIVYNEELSGVGVTWDYFHPHRPMPMLYAHIQDRDLWKFELDGTKEVCSALFSLDQSHNLWNSFLYQGAVAKLKLDGLALQRQKTKDCEQLKTVAYARNLAGYPILTVNAPWMFASELGHILAASTELHEQFHTIPDIACVYYRDGKAHHYSLRSIKGAKLLAREVAERLLGGGHDHAAGAKVPLDRNSTF